MASASLPGRSPVAKRDVESASAKVKQQIAVFLYEDWKQNPEGGWVWLQMNKPGLWHPSLYVFINRGNLELHTIHYGVPSNTALWFVYKNTDHRVAKELRS